MNHMNIYIYILNIPQPQLPQLCFNFCFGPASRFVCQQHAGLQCSRLHQEFATRPVLWVEPQLIEAGSNVARPL